MASDISFVEFVIEQLQDLEEVYYRMMFGEYIIYCRGKVVALVCDNKLYVKPTEAGRKFIGDVVEAPAYPGAKPSFLIEDKIEDREWLSNLINLTEKELPKQRPRGK